MRSLEPAPERADTLARPLATDTLVDPPRDSTDMRAPEERTSAPGVTTCTSSRPEEAWMSMLMRPAASATWTSFLVMLESVIRLDGSTRIPLSGASWNEARPSSRVLISVPSVTDVEMLASCQPRPPRRHRVSPPSTVKKPGTGLSSMSVRPTTTVLSDQAGDLSPVAGPLPWRPGRNTRAATAAVPAASAAAPSHQATGLDGRGAGAFGLLALARAAPTTA